MGDRLVEDLKHSKQRGAPLILHVDDELNLLLIVEKMLTRAGYRVAKALDGYEALDLAPRLLPDLIITGIMMPNMDGFELIHHLKASPITQNIPVMVLSARADSDTINYGLEIGAVKYLTKPILHHALIEAVRSVLPPLPAQ